MAYTFHSRSYSTLDRMLDAVTEAWLTPSQEAIADYFRNYTDMEIARECAGYEGFNLSLPSFDDEIPSHMDRYDYDMYDLSEAFGRAREQHDGYQHDPVSSATS